MGIIRNPYGYPPIPWCNVNGVKYYWGDPPNIEITFNNSTPSGAYYKFDGVNYYPITTNSFVMNSTHTLWSKPVLVIGNITWKFDRWNFGSNNNPTNYECKKNAIIYAIYVETPFK